MKTTKDLQVQACRWDGRWYAVTNALEVDCASGLVKVSGPNGSAVESVGVFRVLDLNTDTIIDQTVQPTDSGVPMSTPASEPMYIEHVDELP